MKTKFTLVALGAMLLTVGCSSNTPSTTGTQSTSVEPSTSSITPKTRSEKVKDAASNISDVFAASRESLVSLDTTFVVTLTNFNIAVPGEFEIVNLSGIVSLCSYKVEPEDEIKIGFSTIFTSGDLKVNSLSIPLGGLGFNYYLLDSTSYLDLSNPFMTGLLVTAMCSLIKELTPETALIALENIIGVNHKIKFKSGETPHMNELSNYLLDVNNQIDDWYSKFDFSILEGPEYSFIDSGFSFIERQSGSLESTLTISKSGYYALAIAGATSDEELIEITNRYNQIEKVDTSIGLKTDSDKRLNYVSLYIDFVRTGNDPFSIEGSVKLDIKYDTVGISLPKSFADYSEINI